MELSQITEKNWRESALPLAKERFPIGALVQFHYGVLNFGRVQGYTPTGKINVTTGTLPRVGSELHGAYWYLAYDPSTFEERSANRYNPYPERIRFTPSFCPLDTLPADVVWYRGQAGILRRLDISEDGLVHETQLNR